MGDSMHAFDAAAAGDDGSAPSVFLSQDASLRPMSQVGAGQSVRCTCASRLHRRPGARGSTMWRCRLAFVCSRLCQRSPGSVGAAPWCRRRRPSCWQRSTSMDMRITRC